MAVDRSNYLQNRRPVEPKGSRRRPRALEDLPQDFVGREKRTLGEVVVIEEDPVPSTSLTALVLSFS